MIPPLTAIPLAAPLISRLLQGGGASPSPQRTSASEKEMFAKQLDHSLRQGDAAEGLKSASHMNHLIALQHGGSVLQPELQQQMAQQLLYKMVQLTDSHGAPVVGRVDAFEMTQGQAMLWVKGQRYPLKSLQAVLSTSGGVA